MAYLFRLNKAATLLGGFLTNTWLSLVSFLLALKIGAAILGVNWHEVEAQARALMDHFTWKAFLNDSVWIILKPLLIGYTIVGFLCGFFSYIVVLILLNRRKKGKG